MYLKYTQPVETTGGKIRGYYQKDGLMVFKGVPYAEPPVGEKRWKPAEPYRRREGVKDCVAYAHSAWQNPLDEYSKQIWTQEFLIDNRDYSEDCLTLNLWVPEGQKGLPVILYFYGGCFVSGGSSCEIYDGTSCAENGVIYISFNHREGVFGWHANDDLRSESNKGLAGNYMLSDAIAALIWIRDNIERFGGDPGNVTIWGQSAGASEVNLLAVSPVAKDLFRRTLSMGYNSFAMKEWRKLEEICEEGNQLEREFGGSLAKMRAVSPEEYLPHFHDSAPAIDGYYTDGQFCECVRKGYGADKPFMMGVVAEDGQIMKICRQIFACADIAAFRALLKVLFPDSAEEIEKKYVADESNFKAAIRPMARDILLKGLLDFAQARSQAAPGSDTYLYMFRHVMPGPLSERYGAFHSFEVPYFTNHLSDLRKDYWTDTDRKMGEMMNAELVSYAKTGRPLSEAFKPSDGGNIYIIDSDRQFNEILSVERINELTRLFGQS